MMLAPFDHAMNASEEKWGVNRLPELVSVDMAEKWGSAMAKLNAAISEGNPEEIKARVGVCIRGLAAMEAEAIAHGHKPKPAEVWEYEYEGRVFAVMREGKDHKTLGDHFKGRRIYTMREVAIALNHLDKNLFAAVKDQFPDSNLVGIKKAPPVEFPEFEEVPF
ncbi:hypothetical protein RM190_04865 [Paracoccus sp. CPCC 101403]|uniref:Phage protein n=1 Tax=Paracoccus broussonetiae TaxID=3075834 RepID=A0ABU3EAL8_9RHOB|nr:hypothetical protein [Paracoccus sp. CPCC 101403]MDT1061180.1 hypothetical protein [Paracoccus sp. CPCC 101403]